MYQTKVVLKKSEGIRVSFKSNKRSSFFNVDFRMKNKRTDDKGTLTITFQAED